MLSAVEWRIRSTWGTLRATKRRRIISTTLMVLIVFGGGIRLWTWWPDTVHITVTEHFPAYAIDNGPVHEKQTKVVYDRSIQDAALAQRLQRDVDDFPIPFANSTRSVPNPARWALRRTR